MPSNKTKYTEEIRRQTAQFIIESGRSATSVGEDIGINTNTVCRQVREYRRLNNLPSYEVEKVIEAAKALQAQNQ